LTASERCRVGVDIGGTFTDLVLVATSGAVATRKISSTTDDYARGIILGLQELLAEQELAPSSVEEIVHGTTVATNAILEGKGARTALVTTEGFRDVLELQRIRIPELYNLFYEKPRPLVPRRHRFEVRERIGPRGEVWEPLDQRSLEQTIGKLASAGVESVAICFLNSYINPAHEREVRDAIRSALPDLFVTCSTDLLTEIREYERTSTTVINAYVGPLVRHYLHSLTARLAEIGVEAPLLVMQCSGGVMSAELAAERPAYLVESGPAAGVKAAAALAKLGTYRDLITLDMGGTTAKASAIEQGEVSLTSEFEVGGGINLSSMLVKGGGYALKVPVIDVSEIGAGGGSIVWIDKGGRLRIGPQSAGAVPGPVCYDAGGEEPTVTDANVVLGYLNPDYLAGGRVRLNTRKALSALEERVAAPLGLSALSASYGVFTLAASSMVRAVKAVSTYRGRDPRDFVLLAFGGNGPVCAVEMARMLQMPRVVIPPAAGLFSALGLLQSDIEHQIVQTFLRSATESTIGHLNEAYERLEQEAVAVLIAEGYEGESVSLRRGADLRYAEQGYELTLPVSGAALAADDIAGLIGAFDREHMRTYGHRADDEPVDIVNLRVTSRIATNGHWVFEPERVAVQPAAQETRDRDAYFGPELGRLGTPVITRAELTSEPAEGPVIIEEPDATCIVPPGCSVRLDEWTNLVIEL
jgi:N-methylhydantoinase A